MKRLPDLARLASRRLTFCGVLLLACATGPARAADEVNVDRLTQDLDLSRRCRRARPFYVSHGYNTWEADQLGVGAVVGCWSTIAAVAFRRARLAAGAT
jgi:hypothetical protein